MPRQLFVRNVSRAQIADRAEQRQSIAGAIWQLNTPTGCIALLILATLAVRAAFGAALGLGVDESYLVAAGRALRAGYYDHPPAAWWIAWLATHLAGSDAPIVVRTPFIALFALTTWLLYRLATTLFDVRAGLWAAVALNLMPVFGVSSGGWVLPDGPLICALLGAVLCLVHGLRADTSRAVWWWLTAGVCMGLALFSKLSAALVLFGGLIFLLSHPRERRWMRRPEPYLALLVTLLVFAPVVAWNAGHGWPSFLFQGSRALPSKVHYLAPFTLIAAQALILLPWCWFLLIAELIAGLRRGRADTNSWLLVCLALPAVILFPLVALWSSQRVLPHWSAPGYLMLLPLLGARIAREIELGRRLTRFWLSASAALMFLGLLIVGSEMSFEWVPDELEMAPLGRDPDIDLVDRTSVRTSLTDRGLLHPGVVVGALKWYDAGKLDYAFHGVIPVICLSSDQREFGLIKPAASFVGKDVLVVVRESDEKRLFQNFRDRFSRIDTLPPTAVSNVGEPKMQIGVFLGHVLAQPDQIDPQSSST